MEQEPTGQLPIQQDQDKEQIEADRSDECADTIQFSLEGLTALKW